MSHSHKTQNDAKVKLTLKERLNAMSSSQELYNKEYNAIDYKDKHNNVVSYENVIYKKLNGDDI